VLRRAVVRHVINNIEQLSTRPLKCDTELLGKDELKKKQESDHDGQDGKENTPKKRSRRSMVGGDKPELQRPA